jgi:hypothetical protein
MRALVGAALALLLSTSVQADSPVLLVDSPNDQAGVRQPTRIYQVNLGNAALTLKADLGDTFTPVLGLAAANSSVLYAIGSVNSTDPAETCFSCFLLKIVLDPQSTIPTITPVGRLEFGGATVTGFTAMGFRANGTLYAVAEYDDALYAIDPETAALMPVGTLTVDSGGGCTTTVLDVTGGDLAFDALDRLWLWNNTPTAKGLWLVNPGNACAVQSAFCPNSRNMAGMAIPDHTATDTILRGTSPQDDRLYRVVPGACPVNGEASSLPLRRNGVGFDHTRGDADSPYCENDPSCDDEDLCTIDQCSPGGCLYEAVACDDGNPCTDDSCDGVLGCQVVPHVCDDGDACTVDGCDPASGCVTAPLSCDDGNPCTDDSCDAVLGCQVVPHVCDDGDACTGDGCDPAVGCVTAPLSCDDGNPCTDDSCDTEAGCAHLANSASCDDGNPCTEQDACGGGVCEGTPVLLAEVQGLTVAQPLGGFTYLAWSAQEGPDLSYDVVSGVLPGGLGTASCLRSNLAQATVADDRPDPPVNEGYFYLVRSAGTCGDGPYGRTSTGQERVPAADCP